MFITRVFNQGGELGIDLTTLSVPMRQSYYYQNAIQPVKFLKNQFHYLLYWQIIFWWSAIPSPLCMLCIVCIEGRKCVVMCAHIYLIRLLRTWWVHEAISLTISFTPLLLMRVMFELRRDSWAKCGAGFCWLVFLVWVVLKLMMAKGLSWWGILCHRQYLS